MSGYSGDLNFLTDKEKEALMDDPARGARDE
jgi:hypothetical protein